ncbi:hypothetical protein EV188_103181 [Actinomycetospora succinea]|uniref:Uncharacterized protein n=1 Tax=Actinomycetospora succinea TaxID=663603 RepID=A0A4R6VD66_9PSEU|nr:hypothetical protein [Actinomycetospora succinea]TDQ60682.1 hypothetical protein EV188_103181 [Actinomycetospora succinea]
MDAHQDPWVPAPRDGGRADIRAGGDPWSPTIPFPRVAPALERLPEQAVTAPSTALAVRAPEDPGFLRTCARAVARLAHVTADGVRSLVALLAPAPASR